MTYALKHWKRPPPLASGLVPVRASTRKDFISRFMAQMPKGRFSDRNVWLMTEAQRESWKNEIAANWVQYFHLIGKDGTARHRKQLKDMSELGAMSILIGQEGGMGKSQINLTHLKLWALGQMKEFGYMRPSIYFRKVKAKRGIANSPAGSAHGIDEDQDDSGTGSGGLVKSLRNLFKTGVRKPKRIVVYAGIDVDPSSLGNSVSLYIKPFGFNRYYQANRFMVYNNKKEPLWLAALQRCFLPHEEVYYEGELGTVGEYEARAEEFSITTDGVHSARDEESEKYWKDELVKYISGRFPDTKLKIDALKYYATNEVGIPEPVQQSLNEIIAAAQLELGFLIDSGDGYQPNKVRELDGDEWDDLRAELQAISNKEFAEYHVPSTPKESYYDIVSRLELDILPDSLGKRLRIRRRRLTPKAIGDAGEKAVTSWLDSLGAVWGGGGDETADVLLPDNIAINVKTTLKDSFKDQVETTPECDYPVGIAALLIPRILQIRLYPVDNVKTSLNSSRGRLATPLTLGESLQEMIEHEA